MYRLFQPVDSVRRRLLTDAAATAGDITQADRRGLVVAKLFYFVFFGAIGCIAPYFNIHLQDLGLSGTQIGWLGSIPPLVALVANPFWGALADRRRAHTAVLVGCALIAGVVSLLFIPAAGFWMIMVLVVLLFFFRAPIPAITDSAVMSMVTRTGASYGRQRMWGSVGFVLASYGLGRVVTSTQLDVIFWLHALLLGVFLAGLAFMLPIERFSGQVNLWAGLRVLSRQRSYVGFLVAMVLMGMASAGYINFLGLHVLALGGRESQVGLAFAASALTEIPVMFLGARWFSHVPNTRLITMGFTVFIVAWFCIGIMAVPWAVIATASFVGIGYGFFWVAVVGFANDHAPEGMGATAQATVGAAQGGLGWGLGALIAGTIWDLAGGSAVFWASAFLVTCALVVFRLGLRGAQQPAVR